MLLVVSIVIIIFTIKIINMREKKVFTVEQEQEIINLYASKIKCKDISKILNISTCHIYPILHKHKQIKDRYVLNSEIELIDLYNQNYSITDISNKTKFCRKTVALVLKNHNIPIKGGFYFTRKDNFNERYFEKIDTEDKAYFLGLLYADGNVYLKRNRVQITLQNEDTYILEVFKNYIDSTCKLYVDRGLYRKLILASEKMCQDLIKLGCVPKKSLILTFPIEEQVPNHLLHHFVRGAFDGDGSIGYVNKTGKEISFTSSESFCNSVKSILESQNIKVSKFSKRYKDKINSAGSIKIYQNNKTFDLFNYMYKDATIYLERKYLKFKNENNR